MHNPDILVLVETRVSSDHLHSNLANSRLDSFVVVEALDFAGGIWVIWDSKIVDFDLITAEDQVVNIIVHQSSRLLWFMSTVYASTQYRLRQNLWNYMCELAEVVHIP